MSEIQDLSMQEAAIAKLTELVATPGALKIITAIAVEGSEAPPQSPAHWVLQDVVSLEGPDHKNRMVAHAADGSWTVGLADALLRRLTQWNAG